MSSQTPSSPQEYEREYVKTLSFFPFFLGWYFHNIKPWYVWSYKFLGCYQSATSKSSLFV